jgi:hypothetical protein
MTIKQAQDIKQWRTVEECTWRTVAMNYSTKYDLPITSNQLYGMELCYEAMTLLGEDVEDGWN